MYLKFYNSTLAGMAQLVGVSVCNLKVAGSISSQGTYLGFGFDSQSRCI